MGFCWAGSPAPGLAPTPYPNVLPLDTQRSASDSHLWALAMRPLPGPTCPPQPRPRAVLASRPGWGRAPLGVSQAWDQDLAEAGCAVAQT